MCLVVFCSAFPPACFVEKPILTAGNCLDLFLKDQLAIFLWVSSRFSVLLPSLYLSVLIPMPCHPAACSFSEVSKSGSVCATPWFPSLLCWISTLFAFLCKLQNQFISMYRIAFWDFYWASIDSTDQMRKG